MVALAVAAILSWINGGKWIMGAGGALVLVVGVGLIVYYLTFGIYYDEDSFLYQTFGKPGVTYDYDQIQGQKLYNASGNIVVELHMTDGSAVSIQSAMEGAYPFLDYAFARWCEQTGKTAEDCPFHDPANSLWFPTEEE